VEKIETIIDEVITSNPNQAASFRAGKTAVLGFFVGQVMMRLGDTTVVSPCEFLGLLQSKLTVLPQPTNETQRYHQSLPKKFVESLQTTFAEKAVGMGKAGNTNARETIISTIIVDLTLLQQLYQNEREARECYQQLSLLEYQKQELSTKMEANKNMCSAQLIQDTPKQDKLWKMKQK